MKSITEHIRNHLYELYNFNQKQSLDSCVRDQCEWSKRFMTLMIHRLTFGRYRYGDRKNESVRKQLNYLKSATDRLMLYNQTGNTEHLIDAANLILLEFRFGYHKTKHFKSIDDGDHCKEK